jgi:hypothetical protein
MLRYPEGLRVLELKDSYKGVMEDLTVRQPHLRISPLRPCPNPTSQKIKFTKKQLKKNVPVSFCSDA